MINDSVTWFEENTETSSVCRICGNGTGNRRLLSVATNFSEQDDLIFVDCPSCGSAYVENFVTASYENYNAYSWQLRYYVEQGAAVDLLAKPAVVAHEMGAKSYLEIGCGYGFAIDFARRAYGLEASGIDPSYPAKIGREQLGIPITSQYLTADNAETRQKHDVIAAMEVLEHIEDIPGFLHIVRSNLGDEGLFLGSTPNARVLDTPDDPMLLAVLFTVAIFTW